MEYNEICGKRQLEFMKQFDYIREAGTDGEEKAALEIRGSLRALAWTAAWKNLRSIRGGSLKLNSL